MGFYHSHPDGHPRPSASDCEHAGGDGRVWAIVAGDAVRFWRDTREGFVEAPLVVVTARGVRQAGFLVSPGLFDAPECDKPKR